MLSLNMVVCNEAHHLRAALTDIRPFVDEIVVVVQQSDDYTLDLARELADVVIEHPRYGYCEASRPAALAASSGKWVLALDADERLTTFGKDNLRSWTNGAVGFYALRRLTRIDGSRIIEDCPHGRLFRRDTVRVPTALHTCYEAVGPIRVISDYIVIAHEKTHHEQHLDDVRYRQLM